MHRLPATALTTLTLALTGCGPGWDGPGTIVELELIDHETNGHRLTNPGNLEVTVATDNDTEASVEVRPECVRDLEIGQTLTETDLTTLCGDLNHSTDD